MLLYQLEARSIRKYRQGNIVMKRKHGLWEALRPSTLKMMPHNVAPSFGWPRRASADNAEVVT